MQLGESMEDYLEAILVLSKCLDHVRSVDVASYLGFSKPSVSHAVKLLSEQGLIVLDVSKFLTLSEEGRKSQKKHMRVILSFQKCYKILEYLKISRQKMLAVLNM